MQKVVLSCPYGLMTQIVPNGVGVTPSSSQKKDACLVDQKLYDNQHCSSMLDSKQIDSFFQEKCFGKEDCALDFNSESAFWKAGADTKCHNENNFIFVQYTCEMTDAQKFAKYETISRATLIVLLCSAIFFITVYYMQHTSDLDGYVFDVQTVTAKDYTVEMDITTDMWQDFEDF